MKKILCVLLTVCLLATAFTMCAFAADTDKETTHWADYNQDGDVNLKDVLTLRQDLATGVDGVCMEDVLYLRLYLAGIFWLDF